LRFFLGPLSWAIVQGQPMQYCRQHRLGALFFFFCFWFFINGELLRTSDNASPDVAHAIGKGVQSE
jgi:hypothetical protein